MPIVSRRLNLAAFAARTIERRYPPRGIMLPVAGGRLHVLQSPRPRTARENAVVLLHGASGNACDMGLDLFDVLSRDRQVFSFDRPGHGWSSRPGGEADADPDRQAGLILDALHRLGLRQVIVVAHSWSGGLALAMGLRAPHMIAGVVLLAGATHPWPGGRIAWYNSLGARPIWGPAVARLAPLGQIMLAKGLDAVFHPQKPPPGFVERTALPLLFRPGQFAANAQDMAGLHGFLTWQAVRYGDLTIPVIALVSDADRIVPMEHGTALSEQSGMVELRVLSGLGHALQHLAVGAAARAVDDIAGRGGEKGGRRRSAVLSAVE